MKTFKQLLENIKIKHPFGTPVFISHDRYDINEDFDDFAKYAKSVENLSAKYPEAKDDELLKHHDYHSMTPEHRAHLYRYTKDSDDINIALWNSHKNNTPVPNDDSMHEYIKHMDHAMKAKPLPDHLGKIHLWSGVKFNPGWKAAKGGGKIFMPAFTSSSLSFETASTFAHTIHPHQEDIKSILPRDADYSLPSERHIILFHTHPGHHGFFMGTNSRHKNEREFILPRNLSVHVDPAPERINQLGTPINIWHAHTAEDSPHIHNDGIKE